MGKSSQKKLLWLAFAEFVKLRDSPNGYANCISCNKIVRYPNSDGMLHAGHLWPRSVVYNAVYFHEMNVHAQCHFCNTHLEGNTLKYREGIIQRYGEQVLDELEQARAVGQLKKWTDDEYKELAKEYRKKNREMKKERGLS